MPTHNMSKRQWARVCKKYFEDGMSIGDIAQSEGLQVHNLTGGDSLVGYAMHLAMRRVRVRDTNKQAQKVFVEGRAKGNSGLAYVNPYDKLDGRHAHWEDGWSLGHHEHEERVGQRG